MKIKFDYFFERHKIIFYTVSILLFVSLIIYGYFLFKGVNLKVSPSMVGVIGAVIGAIVAGVLALFGSIYVHNNQMKSKSAIFRKNVIYKPLYDELIEIKNILKDKNPYPTYVTFSKGQQTLTPHPQFSAWGRIKNDSRLIQTPQYLADGFEKLYEAVYEYLNGFSDACADIQDKINEILFEKHNTKCTIQNLGSAVISDIILKKKPRGTLLKDYIDPYALESRKSITDDELLELDDLVYEECHRLESVKKLIVSYNGWLDKQDELITTLRTLIKLISIKYEKHSEKY